MHRKKKVTEECYLLMKSMLSPATHRGRNIVAAPKTKLRASSWLAAMQNAIWVVVGSVGLACLSAPRVCRAEEFTASDVMEDAKLYFTAPLRWGTDDWLFFGGTVAAVGAAHAYDTEARKHFAVGNRAILNGDDSHSLRDALPAVAVVAGTWAFATLINDSTGRVESYTMLEAAGFSLATTEALKFAAGRERPDETTHVNEWREGGSSFPAAHASVAFAVGTVLAESGGDNYRWLRRILGYGMASATAYVRLRDNVHWLSDTVAGAAIGISTAEFTMNRREKRARRWELSVEPMAGGGSKLAFTMTLH